MPEKVPRGKPAYCDINDVVLGRVGSFTDMNGRRVEITAGMFNEVVSNYDSAYHEAKFIPGHADGTAAGKFKSLRTDGTYLYGNLTQVPIERAADFTEFGPHNKRSMEIYPNLDGKGAYLRNAAYLSGEPPAIKGMPDIRPDQVVPVYTGAVFSFSEAGTDEQLYYVFTEAPAVAAPPETTETENEMATEKLIEKEAPAKLAEPAGDVISLAEYNKLAEQNAKLLADVAKANREAAAGRVNQFITSLGTRVTKGMEKAGLASILLFAETQGEDATLKFSEADGGGTFSLSEALANLLQAIPEGTKPLGAPLAAGEGEEGGEGLSAADLKFAEDVGPVGSPEYKAHVASILKLKAARS